MQPRKIEQRRRVVRGGASTAGLALVLNLTTATSSESIDSSTAVLPGAIATAAQVGSERIVNGDFSDGLTAWTNYPNPVVADGEACIDVPAGTGAYGAAISQEPLPMLKDVAYALTFTASITPGSSSTVRAVIQAGAEQNYARALPEEVLALTPERQQFSYAFTPTVDIPQAEIAVQQTTTNTAAYRLCVDAVSLTGGAAPVGYEPDTGPRVRVNQVGYLPKGPKSATLVTDATAPTPWKLTDAAGTVLTSGTATPRATDASSGLSVQVIDFGAHTRVGESLVLVADGATSHPFDISATAYGELRKDTKTCFYTQRSGTAISDDVAPGYGRAAGHLGSAPNQGDTAVPCQDLTDSSQSLYDEPWTCDYLTDVTAGWYDAGDHGKYMVNGGIAVAQLMQEFERTRTAPSAHRGARWDNTLRVPEAGNGRPDILDEVRWELEWMIKMQVAAGRPMAGMAFHKVADVDWTGLPMAPAADPQRRVLYRPSTAATLNLAAVTAQGARIFVRHDRAFAAQLLRASTTAYSAALANPAVFAPAPDAALDPNAGSGPYDDADVSDEFYWAAAELYLATGAARYRDAILASSVRSAAWTWRRCRTRCPTARPSSARSSWRRTVTSPTRQRSPSARPTRPTRASTRGARTARSSTTCRSWGRRSTSRGRRAFATGC